MRSEARHATAARDTAHTIRGDRMATTGAAWMSRPPGRDARASTRGRTPVILDSRLVGVRPAVALVILEFALFALSGGLFGPLHVTGSAGAWGDGALTLPGPQLVVPRMTHSAVHPRPPARS